MRDLHVSFPKPCGEGWETMTPAGRARVCAHCDKAVHDLSRYTLDEAEALLRGKDEVCVRARLDSNGSVALQPDRRGNARRMVAAMTATAGLLAATAPALANQERPEGAIAGHVDTSPIRVHVSATGSNGQTYRGHVKANGHFRINHLPAGTYTLTFRPDCGDKWTVENVAVGTGETALSDTQNAGNAEHVCIVVGLLRIDDDRV